MHRLVVLKGLEGSFNDRFLIMVLSVLRLTEKMCNLFKFVKKIKKIDSTLDKRWPYLVHEVADDINCQ